MKNAWVHAKACDDNECDDLAACISPDLDYLHWQIDMLPVDLGAVINIFKCNWLVMCLHLCHVFL